ncbi:VanZ family protein [Deinococcus sp. YIM 134068]|uniref:VanZ family protein n=1 Tax=Deinococcus lichenicola TaxID=3118910 RepID=UPI002F9444A9
MTRRARPLWWLPALGAMAAIWWLSSGADTPGPPLPHPLDWAAHFTAYLILSFCVARATGRRGGALVLAAWFGAVDEVHQAFVPGREAGVTDWLFDVAGAWMGALVAVPGPVRGRSRPVPVLSEPHG